MLGASADRPCRPTTGAPALSPKKAEASTSKMLYVRIISAKEIRPVGLSLSVDPYVEITVNEEGKPSTQQVTWSCVKNLCPIWEQEFCFEIENSANRVTLDMKLLDDEGSLKAPIFLGQIQPLVITPDANLYDAHLKLSLYDSKGHNPVKGHIYAQLHYYDYVSPPGSDRSCQTFHHSFTHLLRGHMKAVLGDTFPLYTIKLDNVGEIFGDVQHHWNENYDNAQKIFNSATVQGVITVQHQSLYGGRNTVDVPVNTGNAFLSMIQYGKIHGKKQFYTYCLLDDRLNFASTGASFYKDFTSKHAMHSNCSVYVRYAGEFHVIENQGQHILVIDNNSGTYAPTQDNMHLAKRVFELNFPGLVVDTVHWADPKLKEYKSAVESYNQDFVQKKKANKTSLGL